jgi:2-oxoglutarate ferredoxin oxidoreductase subunit alpha
MPLPKVKMRDPQAKVGAIFYGTTTHSAYEVIDRLHHRGVAINSLRIRAFPFQQEVMDFIRQHDLIFVIEQNRDGQMRTLLINEGNLDPAKLVAITNYDGLPVASRYLFRALDTALQERGLLPSPTASGQGGAL